MLKKARIRNLKYKQRLFYFTYRFGFGRTSDVLLSPSVIVPSPVCSTLSEVPF
jgi:hypothetical protein